MVCQVALTDGRIILPTVKNSGGTLGHFACCLQNVAFKNHLSVLVIFFSHILLFIWLSGCIFFNSHSTHRAHGTRMELVDNNFRMLYLVQSGDHCSQCIYNDMVYTYRPIHHIMEYERKKRPITFLFLFHCLFWSAVIHRNMTCLGVRFTPHQGQSLCFSNNSYWHWHELHHPEDKHIFRYLQHNSAV